MPLCRWTTLLSFLQSLLAYVIIMACLIRSRHQRHKSHFSSDVKSTHSVLSWLHQWNRWSMFDRNHRNTDDTSHAHQLAFSRLS